MKYSSTNINTFKTSGVSEKSSVQVATRPAGSTEPLLTILTAILRKITAPAEL
jgi:hypothetical protein